MIKLYGADWCGYCKKAMALLDLKGIKYEYLDVDIDDIGEQFKIIYGKATLPQVSIDDVNIGGFTELQRYLKETCL